MITSSSVATGVPGSQLPASSAGPNAGSASSGTTGSGAAAPGSALLTQNFNTFLTLLTTQLQNQDPLSPLDTNQFTQQLVSFSEVEQQINTNSNLQSLISLQQTSQALSALPLVGKSIQYNSATAPLSGGQASFAYTIPSAAQQATLVITDASGQAQLVTAGDASAGTHAFTWNGRTTGGNTAPDGNYTLAVSAIDARGNALTVPITSSGVVSGVSVQNNVATFNVDGISVPMTELVTVNSSTSN